MKGSNDRVGAILLIGVHKWYDGRPVASKEY